MAQKKSALLAKYSLQYEKKPKSRVFAPLAETYRKLGMFNEAIKVLRSGIKNHPQYPLGYIVLANVYFDKQNYEIAYSTLRPFVDDNLENLSLQKLFAKICVNLGYLDEALQTYKHLLLVNPKDPDVAKQVKLLEDDLLVDDEEVIKPTFVEKRQQNFEEDDDWVQVNFNTESRRVDDDVEKWEVKKNNPIDDFKDQINSEKIEIVEHDLDDDYYFEDYDNQSDDVISPEFEENDVPIITHTLADIYLSQGHYEKALEAVEYILQVHPKDEASLRKKSEILLMIEKDNFNKKETKLEVVKPEVESLSDEVINRSIDLGVHVADETISEEGVSLDNIETEDDSLLRLIEEKKEKDKAIVSKVEERLYMFLEKINNEAKNYQD